MTRTQETGTMATIDIAPHGDCDIVEEHGSEWAVCSACGAQWSLSGADLERVTEGDETCDDETCYGCGERTDAEGCCHNSGCHRT